VAFPLCAVCEDRYISYFGGECTACPSRGGSVAFLFFMALLLFGLYVAMMYVVMRGGQALLNQEGMLARKRMIAQGEIAPDADLDVGEPEDGDEFDKADQAAGAKKEEEAVLAPQAVRLTDQFLIQRPAEFMFKMKIVIGFLQVISNVALSLEIPWPAAYKEFVSFFSIANVDFIQASSAGCVVESGFYRKFIVMCCTPVIFGVLVLCLYMLPQYWLVAREAARRASAPERTAKKALEDEAYRLYERKRARRNFWRMFIFSLFLIYPLVSSTILRVFVCKSIYGTTYLLADMRKLCHTCTCAAVPSLLIWFAADAALLVSCFHSGMVRLCRSSRYLYPTLPCGYPSVFLLYAVSLSASESTAGAWYQGRAGLFVRCVRHKVRAACLDFVYPGRISP